LGCVIGWIIAFIFIIMNFTSEIKNNEEIEKIFLNEQLSPPVLDEEIFIKEEKKEENKEEEIFINEKKEEELEKKEEIEKERKEEKEEKKEKEDLFIRAKKGNIYNPFMSIFINIIFPGSGYIISKI
jgi:hypothetical protein